MMQNFKLEIMKLASVQVNAFAFEVSTCLQVNSCNVNEELYVILENFHGSRCGQIILIHMPNGSQFRVI